MNRIWKHIAKRRPPKPPYYTMSITKHMAPSTLEMNMQSIVAKRFVICEEWRQEHQPDAPENPHPWCIVGVHRESIYNTNIALMLAPFQNDGFIDVSRAIRVPAGKVGVAAKQDSDAE